MLAFWALVALGVWALWRLLRCPARCPHCGPFGRIYWTRFDNVYRCLNCGEVGSPSVDPEWKR